jgi:coenzyme PQQ synthesis protein D (PqqD)/2-oxoglutarate-Fe(II)-dependent oxygenase superfamily protein
MTGVRLADSVISREVGGALVVLDVERRAYFQLDRTAAAIWRAIQKLGQLEPVIEACTSTFALDSAVVARDVRGFVADAVGWGLLTECSHADVSSDSQQPAGDVSPLSVDRSGLRIAGDLEELRRQFAEQPYVALPGFVAPALLSIVERAMNAGDFAHRVHPGIGEELCLESGPATAACQLVFNDPALLAAVTQIAACSTLRCFDGRVYRLEPQAGHYDSWHSDASDDRMVGLSVNLTRERFSGGVLEIRRAVSLQAEYTVPHVTFGSAVLFRISPALRHRVTPVRGGVARAAYAGWFRGSPDFADVFTRALNGRAASAIVE